MEQLKLFNEFTHSTFEDEIRTQVDKNWKNEYDLERLGEPKFHEFLSTEINGKYFQVWEDDCGGVYLNDNEKPFFTWEERHYNKPEIYLRKIKQRATNAIINFLLYEKAKQKA